jgi:hypothetical protein
MGRKSEGRKRKGCLHVRGMDGGWPSSVEEREIIKGKKKMEKKKLCMNNVICVHVVSV